MRKNAYKIKLLKETRIYPVFHVSLLEKAPNSILLLKKYKANEEEDNQEYDVKKIIDTRLQDKKRYYLVKWLGYTDAENTWELEKHLKPRCQKKLEEFYQQTHSTTARRTSPQRRLLTNPQENQNRKN